MTSSIAKLNWSVAIVAAALINAVPSQSALHPNKSRIGLSEGDITGSGMESPETVRTQGSRRASARTAADWRALAAQCRSLAEWLNADQRESLLGLAEDYDGLAREIDAAAAGPRPDEDA
jgi:hypothetical protein